MNNNITSISKKIFPNIDIYNGAIKYIKEFLRNIMIEILYKFEKCEIVNRRDIDSSIINFFGVWNKIGKNLIEYAKNTVKSSLIFKISDTNDFIEPIINCKLDDRVLVYIGGVLEYLTIVIVSSSANKKRKILKVENIEHGIDNRKELYHIKLKLERSPRINLIKYVVRPKRTEDDLLIHFNLRKILSQVHHDKVTVSEEAKEYIDDIMSDILQSMLNIGNNLNELKKNLFEIFGKNKYKKILDIVGLKNVELEEDGLSITINKIKNTIHEDDDFPLDDDKLFYIVAILDAIIEDILNASLDRVYDKTGKSPNFIDYDTVFDAIDNDYELNAVFNGNLYENYDDSDDDEDDSEYESDYESVEKNPISKCKSVKTTMTRRSKSRRSRRYKRRRSRRSKRRRSKNSLKRNKKDGVKKGKKRSYSETQEPVLDPLLTEKIPANIETFTLEEDLTGSYPYLSVDSDNESIGTIPDEYLDEYKNISPINISRSFNRKIFNCPYCNIPQYSLDNLSDHVEDSHNKSMYKCPEKDCDYTTARTQDIKKHVDNHKKKEEK